MYFTFLRSCTFFCTYIRNCYFCVTKYVIISSFVTKSEFWYEKFGIVRIKYYECCLMCMNYVKYNKILIWAWRSAQIIASLKFHPKKKILKTKMKKKKKRLRQNIYKHILREKYILNSTKWVCGYLSCILWNDRFQDLRHA